jgi:hypothetical protein
VRLEAILQRLPYSLSLTLSTPDPQSAMSCRLGGAPRPHLTATEPPAPHLLSLSPTPTVRMPVETKASVASQLLLPRHQRPLATINATQSLSAALTSRRSRRSPCSDCATCTPWTPRACIAFPLMHVSTPLAPHTVLHDIERAFTRHTRPARLRLDVSCS